MRSAAPPSRFRRNLWIAAILLLLYTIVGFAIVPAIVKSQLQERLSAALGRTVTVGKVRFNPYACSLTLENFDVREKDAKTSFASWGRLYVNFEPLSSIVGQWAIGDVELDGFHVATLIESDGSLGFADILNRLNPPGAPPALPAGPSRPIRVGRFRIDQAYVDFTDKSLARPFATRVGPFTFNVVGFHTAGGQGAPYHFDATTESGEKLTWSGTIGVQPFRSVGDLSLENFVLGKYSPYESQFLRADITHGKLSVNGHYEVDFSGDHRVLKLDNSDVHIGDLKVTERDSHELALDLPSIDITRINADAIALKATVDAVKLNGGNVRVRRGKDGAINLLAMFPPSAEQPASTTTPSAPAVPTFSTTPGKPAVTAEKLPDILIGEVTTKDLQVDFKDLAASRPVELGLTGIGLSLKKVTLADGATMPLDLSFGWAPQGTVHVDGTVAIKPTLKATLKTDVTGLALLPLSPYLEQFVDARLAQGELTVGLAVAAEMPAGGPLNATVTGDVNMQKFGLVDGAHQQELAGVGDLQVRGIKLTMNPAIGMTVDEVALSHPYARVVVHSDKSLNLASVMRSDPTPKNDVTVSFGDGPVKNDLPRIAINRVVISEGDFSFADHSVQPNVQTAINQFGGTITGLSSANLAKAAVDLKATVDGAGPVAITGQLDPLGAKKFVDLKIDVRNVDLQPVSPYSGKFAGYEIARGKLALDVKFLLDGKKIDSTEVITLNQFTFGAPTNSSDATKLPVRLGVALLKDSDGKIVIDVPVQGSTDDPEFRIGKVVLRVVVNLLTKAATSPFSLLGSMFGGGGDELAYQDFSPGATELLPSETRKLETMVKALSNRPALNVSLDGSYDAAADTYALKQQKLRQMIRHAIWAQQHETSPSIPPPEQLVISPDEQVAMVKQLFDAKFPPGTEFGAPLEKAPVVEAPPPPKKRGFFGRVTDVVTLKKLRGHKEEKEKKAEETKPAIEDVAAGPSLEEMTGRLADTMRVTDNDLTALAHARAKAVRDYFINTGKINPERLFLAKAQQGADTAKAGKGPRVFLELE
ncbi:MAG TPA: DUF748 domain-containing protein [Lacunisphaera sp.]|jgi:hypothetical protein